MMVKNKASVPGKPGTVVKGAKATSTKSGKLTYSPKLETASVNTSVNKERRITWISKNEDSIKRAFGEKIQNLHAVVETARKGVDTHVFYRFAAITGFPETALANLINLTARTVNNYKEKGRALDAPQGEHLLKLISLFEKGEEILGNKEELFRWLETPNWNSDEKFLDWLVTPGGVDLVSQELDRLAEGYSL